MLSMGVLTLPVCVLLRDIFCTMVAHQILPAAPLVVSNDNRRKNARQRAGGSDQSDLDAESRPPGKESQRPFVKSPNLTDSRINRDGKRPGNTQCEVTGVSIRQIVRPIEGKSGRVLGRGKLLEEVVWRSKQCHRWI
jgi:hypothetical protein